MFRPFSFPYKNPVTSLLYSTLLFLLTGADADLRQFLLRKLPNIKIRVAEVVATCFRCLNSHACRTIAVCFLNKRNCCHIFYKKKNCRKCNSTRVQNIPSQESMWSHTHKKHGRKGIRRHSLAVSSVRDHKTVEDRRIKSQKDIYVIYRLGGP